MSGEKPQKINIGFDGGQILSARVAPADVTRLREALGGGSGWHEVSAEDGTVVLDLGKVVYVHVDDEGHRVGFGT